MSRGGDSRDRRGATSRQPTLGLVDRERAAPMSRQEAARLGGLTTLERHGHEHLYIIRNSSI